MTPPNLTDLVSQNGKSKQVAGEMDRTVNKTYLIFDQHFLILDRSMLPKLCLHNLQTDLPNSFSQKMISNVPKNFEILILVKLNWEIF